MMFSDVVRLDPTRRTEPELRLLGDRVSRLWNSANYHCRQEFLAKRGVPTGVRLETAVKDSDEYRQLPSDIAQEILKKLSEAWTSYFELRAKWAADPRATRSPACPSTGRTGRPGSARST